MTGTSQLIAFGHLSIAFDERVLRPRPWTVQQSAWATELLPSLPPGPVLELCAGAGHIGLLAVAGSGRRLVQVDANEVACDFARRNAALAGVAVEVRHGGLDSVLGPLERFPLVIADPPWVPTGETALHPEDPLTAIDGGPDGLEVVRSCLSVIAAHLAAGGCAILQVGGRAQVTAVAEHLVGHPELDLQPAGSRLTGSGALLRLTR